MFITALRRSLTVTFLRVFYDGPSRVLKQMFNGGCVSRPVASQSDFSGGIKP